MSSTIKIKRSSLAGKSPTTANLDTGELALNTSDGRLYSSTGSDIFEIGANVHSLSVGTGGLTLANSSITFPTSDGSTGQVLTTNGSGTLSFQAVSVPVARQTVQTIASNTSLDTSDHNIAVVVNSTESVYITIDESANLTVGDHFTFLPVSTGNIVVKLDGGDGFLGHAGFDTIQIGVYANDTVAASADTQINAATSTVTVATSLYNKIEVLYVGSGNFVLTKYLL